MKIPIKIPELFFCRSYQTDSKIYIGFPRSNSSQRILKKNILRRFDLSAFRIFYKSGVVKQCVLVSGQTNRSMEQTESLKVNPHIYTQLIFDKDTKAIQWRKERLLDKWSWNYWITIYRYRYRYVMNLHIIITQDTKVTLNISQI